MGLKLYTFSIVFALLPGCLEVPTTSSAKGQKSKIFSLMSEEQVSNLNTPSFKVSHLTASDKPLASFGVKLPSISFAVPAKADYIELLRCEKDRQVTQDLISDSRSDSTPSSNWEKATKDSGCKYVSKNITGAGSTVHIDYAATAGSYFYVARACVRSERISGGSNCSDLVTTSYNTLTSHYTYSDRITERVLEVRKMIATKNEAISRITMEMKSEALKLNNARAQCQETQDQRSNEYKRLVNKHNSLVKFMGFAATATGKLLGDGTAIDKLLDVATDATSTFADAKMAPFIQAAIQTAGAAANDKLSFSNAADTLNQLASSQTNSPIIKGLAEGAKQYADKKSAAQLLLTGSSFSNSDSFFVYGPTQGDDTDAPLPTPVDPNEETQSPTYGTGENSGSGANEEKSTSTTILQNVKWGDIRTSIENMAIEPDLSKVETGHRCAGESEINAKLKAYNAEIIAHQLSIGLMNETLSIVSKSTSLKGQ